MSMERLERKCADVARSEINLAMQSIHEALGAAGKKLAARGGRLSQSRANDYACRLKTAMERGVGSVGYCALVEKLTGDLVDQVMDKMFTDTFN